MVEAKETELRRLVERHRVCWESFPEFSRIDQERRQTGTVVEVYGTHDQPSVTPTAGCKQCIPVLQALLSIADFAVDGAEALASVRAHSGIEYATERGGRPDIVVTLTFSGAVGASREIDAAVAAVRARLARLGASERSWRATPQAAAQ